ncbi:hypothetical protein Q31a_16030 [Aureliella helgolandensis]|uniref:Uncharacterized protein n=1 Tax=Aureliella helgolandensis TaxID=2527968 RepID=A0A518G409_9BACT|nr:hypothetical protein Q31a_16030 [Aureliella helgolandensis]
MGRREGRSRQQLLAGNRSSFLRAGQSPALLWERRAASVPDETLAGGGRVILQSTWTQSSGPNKTQIGAGVLMMERL